MSDSADRPHRVTKQANPPSNHERGQPRSIASPRLRAPTRPDRKSPGPIPRGQDAAGFGACPYTCGLPPRGRVNTTRRVHKIQGRTMRPDSSPANTKDSAIPGCPGRHRVLPRPWCRVCGEVIAAIRASRDTSQVAPPYLQRAIVTSHRKADRIPTRIGPRPESFSIMPGFMSSRPMQPGN